MGTYNPFTNINTNMFNQENTEKSIDFDKLLKMANNDDPDAQYEVGNCYLNGIEVEKDEKRAYQWFLKSAQHNNMYGLNGVGSCYRFGRGVKQDLNIAIEWYLKSAELGCVFAMNNLGSCYRDLEDLENHYVISFEWYKKAADLGDEYALNNVGSCYRYGRGVDIDYNEAIEWYKKAAKLNNLFAINNIGSCYRELGDYVESAKWYEKAALAGNSYAQNNLALYYWLGNGVEVDIEKAKKLFIQSATNGNGYAYGNLGKLSFEQGDYANAFMYLTDSENSNDSPIDNAYYLGYLYHNGLGCKMDLSLAKKYYCLAVERGYSCSYSIEMVKRDIELEKYYQEGRKKGKDNNIFGYQLDVFAKDYAREKLAKNSVNGIHEFIDTLIKNNIAGSERRIAIKNEVEKDFGEVWQDLEEGSKTAIVTGIYIYSTFVEMGYNEYQLMDFAPVINELAKSFEIELKNSL